MSELQSQRRVAVVTGANRGIGREVARQLLLRDLAVVVTARDPEAAERTAEALRADGREVYAHQLDITDEDSVGALAEWVRAQLGRWDVLVNNAGIIPDSSYGTPAIQADFDELRRGFETNTLGALRVARRAVPMMEEGGYGRVVNVSSGMAGLAEMGSGALGYRLSKVALNGLTRVLHNETPAEVKVNCVCPGWVKTDMGGPNANREVSAGAAGVVWAATLPEDGPSGGFFRDGEAIAW